MSLYTLSAEVLQYQAIAATKCPKLVESYKDLASDVAYSMKTGDESMSAVIQSQLKTLNSLCSSQGTSAKAPAGSPQTTSPVLVFAVAGIVAYLLFS